MHAVTCNADINLSCMVVVFADCSTAGLPKDANVTGKFSFSSLGTTSLGTTISTTGMDTKPNGSPNIVHNQSSKCIIIGP